MWPKLTIGASNDLLEREADRLADMLLEPPPDVGSPPVSTTRPVLQRVGGAARGAGIDHTSAAGDTDGAVPDLVHQVLEDRGEPLDSATRAFVEARFGVDFGRVRLHTDARAAASARQVGARAYTVGQDVVFGAGEYRPADAAGRRLLGHELAHTLQQRGGMLRLQRACKSAPCPPVMLPITALFPRYEAAEKCLQTLYAATHPAKRGVSLSFNADWLHLTGANRTEKLALGCLRAEETPGAGPNFTARGMMYAAAPDLWDFRNKTMYEITTSSGFQYRVGKLGAQVALANELCGPEDCGGLQFERGPWQPPKGCIALGGDLVMTAINTQGVITYSMFKDATKELALATALAAMAVALKTLGPKAGAAAAAKAVGGKLIPAYAAAGFVAAAVVLASGRAEAKIGLGGDDPLVALFKVMEEKGTPVPPEIQEMLDANPELKEKMEQALGDGGAPDAALEEINKQILDTIAANKDQFTAEELELLLASTRVAGKALPKGNATVQELKRLAVAVKSDKSGGEGDGGEGGDAAPVPTTPESGAAKADPGAKKGAADTKAEVAPETRQKLADSPPQVRKLLDALVGSGAKKRRFDDAQTKRFLALLAGGLTDQQVSQLLEKVRPAADETADEILDTLQAALAGLDKPPAEKGAGDAPASPGDGADPESGDGADAPTTTRTAPSPEATLTIGPTVSSSKKTTPEELIKQLAAKAKKSKFGDVPEGKYRVTWDPDEKGKPTVGTFIAGTLRGKLEDKTKYVGRVEAEVTAVAGDELTIRFVTATPMVSAKGVVVFKADHFVGREDQVVLDPAKKKRQRKRRK